MMPERFIAGFCRDCDNWDRDTNGPNDYVVLEYDRHGRVLRAESTPCPLHPCVSPYQIDKLDGVLHADVGGDDCGVEAADFTFWTGPGFGCMKFKPLAELPSPAFSMPEPTSPLFDGYDPLVEGAD